MALVGFRAPALPLPPNEYNRQQFDELVRALRVYFNLLDSLTPQQAQSYRADNFFGGIFTGDSISAANINGGVINGFNRGIEAPYAMLMSDQDQSSAGVTSENLISYNTPIFQYGIRVENNTRIKFDYPGQYLVVVNCQFTNRSNTAAEFELWAKDQGVNYPLSNTRFDIPARKSVSIYSHVVAVINGIFTINNPDTEYLEIAWWSDNADVYLEHYAAGTSPTRPEIPSVILTANFVSALPSVFPIPQSDHLVMAGAAPSILRGVARTPASGTLVVAGGTPEISEIVPPVGTLTIAGTAPTVT
jgi:hypothetical protein